MYRVYGLDSKRYLLMLEQFFGMRLKPEDLKWYWCYPSTTGDAYYNKLWADYESAIVETGSIKYSEDKIEITLNMQNISPNQISVQIANGFLTVDAIHAKSQAWDGVTSRAYTRCQLPSGCGMEGIKTKFSSDRVLTVTVPVASASGNEKLLSVVQSGAKKQQQTAETSE